MTAPKLHKYPSSGPVSATLRIGGGAVVVYATQTATTTVKISPYDDSDASHAAAAQTQVSMNGDRLHIETPDAHGGWLFRRSGRLQVELRMPLDSQLRAQVGSADIHAEGRLRLIDVKSGSGDVLCADCVDLTVQSGSGDIRAGRVRGTLRVNTGSGAVSAGRVDGQVHVNSASGDVSIEHILDGLRVSSASGDINVQAAHRGHVRINSASGDVFVGVPVGTKVWFDVGTLSGTTSSDLSVSPHSPSGGAHLNLQIHTMSGDISIFRVAGNLPDADDAVPDGPREDETAAPGEEADPSPSEPGPAQPPTSAASDAA